MPFSRVRVLAVRGVVTGVRGARVIRDPIEIVRAARNSRGGKGTEIQTRQWKVHHHVQLAAKALHRRETFQMNNQNFREFLYAEALGALSSHLTFGTCGFLVAVQHFLSREVFQALAQLHRAASSWYRQT